MRRLTVGLIATALLAFGALGTTSAFASHVLPEFTVETGSKGTSGADKLRLTGANLECSSGTSTSSATGSTTLYSFTIDLHGCLLSKKECHSLLDTNGLILVTGTWHIELLQLPKHYWFIYFTINPVHIECTFLSDLIELEGSLLGKITPTGTKTNKFLLEINTISTGEQEFTKYETTTAKKSKPNSKVRSTREPENPRPRTSRTTKSKPNSKLKSSTDIVSR